MQKSIILINNSVNYGERLVHLYGRFALEIVKRAQEINATSDILSLSSLLQAELEYCIDHERVCSLSDFCIQRSGMLYFNRAWISEYQQALQETLEKN